jgi:hypothetical protein
LILAVTAALVVLLVLAHELTAVSRPSAAPAAGGAGSEEAPPKSIREAYQRAENFGEEPSAPAAPPAPAPPSPSPWFDGAHYLGLSAGLLLLAGLGTGLWLYLVVAFRPGKDREPVRRRWRQWHYALGGAAGALALSHAVGRLVQVGSLMPGFWVPAATGFALILLVVSGLLRAGSPPAPAQSAQWWSWSHRALTALAVILLLWHAITMYAQFALHK